MIADNLINIGNAMVGRACLKPGGGSVPLRREQKSIKQMRARILPEGFRHVRKRDFETESS
jgi:hypothetical protein